MNPQYFLLPSEYADAIINCGGAWGTLALQRVNRERLVFIAGWTKADRGGRCRTSEWHRSHFAADASILHAAGVWYRVEPELHDLADALLARGAAIPTEVFKSLTRGGWRIPAHDGANLALAWSVTDSEPRWTAWLVSREQASPVTVDVVQEKKDVLAPLGDAWPVSDLVDRRVMVIGTGSIGSAACEQLVLYGVRKLVLVDPDHVRPHNIARLRLSGRSIGRYKVNAVHLVLGERDPGVEILPLPADVIYQADYLRPLLPEMDTLLVTTDGVEPRRAANHLAARAGVPAVFACVLEDGTFGEIVRVLPRRTGCLLCARAELAKTGGMEPESSLDRGYGTGSRHLPMTAVGGDLSLMGDLAAKCVVATLLERSGRREHRLPGDQAVISLRGNDGYKRPFDLPVEGGVRWRLGAPRRPDCPSCGTT